MLDFYIKLYPLGTMSAILRDLEVGAEMKLAGPSGQPYVRRVWCRTAVHGPGPFPAAHRLLCNQSASGCFHKLGLVAGGAGITPMLQLIDYFLAFGWLDDHVASEVSHGSAGFGLTSLIVLRVRAFDQVPPARGPALWQATPFTRVSLLVAHSTEQDVPIPLVALLQRAQDAAKGRLFVRHVVSRAGPDWQQERGRISKALIERYMPPLPSRLPLATGAGSERAPPDEHSPEGGWIAEESLRPPAIPKWSAARQSSSTRLAVCGPPPFMDAVGGILAELNVDPAVVSFLDS